MNNNLFIFSKIAINRPIRPTFLANWSITMKIDCMNNFGQLFRVGRANTITL
jgi:hypothetical protein